MSHPNRSITFVSHGFYFLARMSSYSRKGSFSSQKQTSWVFNDQPCECADVGHSRKIGRAAKMGWEKILYPAIVAASTPVKLTIGRVYWLTRRTRPLFQIWRHGSDFIYIKNSARPGSGFYLHKLFLGLFGKKLLRKMTDTVYIENFSALRAPIFKDNIDLYKKKPYILNIFPLRGLKS